MTIALEPFVIQSNASVQGGGAIHCTTTAAAAGRSLSWSAHDA